MLGIEDRLLRELEEGRPDGDLPSWESVFNSPDKVKCDCPHPHVARSGSQALGIVVDIDLCCLAQEVEKLTGKRLYTVRYTQPVFTWDCCELVYVDANHPEAGMRERGLPSQWMIERFVERNIEILHLDEHIEHSGEVPRGAGIKARE